MSTVLTPDYRSLLRQESYTSENVSKLLRKLQLQQDQISKKKSKAATTFAKAVRTSSPTTNSTSKTSPPLTSTTSSPARSYSNRIMNGICHVCGISGQIKPDCPDLEGFLKIQAAKIAKQMKELSEKRTGNLSTSPATESVRHWITCSIRRQPEPPTKNF